MVLNYKKSVITFSVGFGFLALGLAFFFSYDSIYRAVLKSQLPLSPDSALYPLWKDIPMPMYFKVYMFNVTNPHEVLRHTHEPKLDEIGPFTFRLHWNKVDITFNPNDTISFRENQKYIFLRNESCGDLSMKITTINTPMVVAADLFKDKPVWQKVALSAIFKFLKESLFTPKTVRELIFEGYFDELMILGRKVNPKLPNTNGFFAFFYDKNDTNDGLFNTNVGKHDLSTANLINRYNGYESLQYWDGQYCNKINTSSNAELGPPLEDGQKTINIFRADLCRSWTLTYDRDVPYYKLRSRRFSADSSVLANDSVNPCNSCFGGVDNSTSLPSGVLNISTCHGGAPIIVSQPHFFQGDPRLREDVSGMKPNATLHSFHLDIDPVIGLTVSMAARLQVNLRLQGVKGLPEFSGFNDTIFPVLWQEISGVVTEEQADEIYKLVYYPPYVMFVVGIFMMSLGSLVAVVGIIIALVVRYSVKEQTSYNTLFSDDDDNAPFSSNGLEKSQSGSVQAVDGT